MNKMWLFTGMLLTVLVASLQADRFELGPLETASCPANDYVTHTCYEMTQKNVSCLNDLLPVCPDDQKVTGKNAGASNSFDSDVIFEWQHWLERFCREFNYQTCITNVCERKCCDGWAADSAGRCTIATDGFMHCENGGAWLDHNNKLCECHPGFAGDRCEEVVCEPDCLNGGTCTQTMLGNQCYCPDPYYGPTCEKVECSVLCLNGGECIVTDYRSACRCKEGFTGKSCRYEVDNKHCLSPNSSICLDPNSCWDRCHGTSDCLDGLVCCNDGCCNSCVRPLGDQVCRIDDKTLRPGQTIRTDSCTTCTCLRNGSFDCAKRTCPDRLPCEESEWIYQEGECCPVCDTDDKLPPGYHPPVLKNCPNSEILLTVPHYSSRAYVTSLGIQAYDFENRALQAIPHPVYLVHCMCPLNDRDGQTVIVSALDRYGRTSECRFRVKVIDKTPPKFLTCPATIHATENEMVSWDTPSAKDNVGVRSLSLNPTAWDTDGYFTKGNHTMTYTAIDYDGNRAFCQFTVFIYDKDTDPSNVPGLSRRTSASHKNIQIIAGCLTVAFVVISVSLLACFIRRWRYHRANNSRSQHCQSRRRQDPSVPCVSNGLYDDEIVANFLRLNPKPPPYTPAVPPPAYEELAVNTGASASETEQPPKYEDLYSYTNSQYEHAYDNRRSAELFGSEQGNSDGGQDQRQESHESEYDNIQFNQATNGASAERRNSGNRRETVI